MGDVRWRRLIEQQTRPTAADIGSCTAQAVARLQTTRAPAKVHEWELPRRQCFPERRWVASTPAPSKTETEAIGLLNRDADPTAISRSGTLRSS